MPAQETSRATTPSFAFRVALAVIIIAGIVGVFGFARFGDPRHMPDRLERLAIRMDNPRTLKSRITPSWAHLCRAWGSWLGNLQRNAPRLLEVEDLLQPNDPLRQAVSDFLATANELRPEALIPEATAEKDLGVLAGSPPEAVLNELLTDRVASRVEETWTRIMVLANRLEGWRRWDEMRALLDFAQDRGFTQTAAALRPKVPPPPGNPGYRRNESRTLKLFYDVSRDDGGTLRLLSRWSEFTQRAAVMQAGGDPEQQAMPGRLLDRLTDQPTLAEFADSLVAPLAEMRRWGPPLPVPDVRPATGEKVSVPRVLTPVPVQHVIPLVPGRAP